MADSFFKVNKGGSFFPQSGTPSNGTNGDIYYDSSLGKFRQFINGAWADVGTGTGSGGGDINYISSNPSAETDTSGWATYADAAGTSPVDGTAGSPTVTWTRTTSTPLRGTASFLFTKDAANRQGQGASFAFTIDEADKGKVLTIASDYAIASGTYANGDLAFFIYDVTNGVVIQPFASSINSATANVPQRFTGIFQAASNSTSYRLIIHAASTSASAYTVKFDNFSVGPKALVTGPAVTDWVAYTPTGNWTTNTTWTGQWRRVGDSMHVQASANFTGAPDTANFTVTIPSGYTIDTTKLSSTSASLGTGNVQDVGTRGYACVALYNNTNSVLMIQTESGNSGLVNATNPFTFGSGDRAIVEFTVPIVGWSSNVAMSSSVRSAPTQQRFVSGTTTYNTPQDVKYLIVRAVAGGGGGGGSGTSASGGTGGTGGTTTVGSYWSGAGGVGGVGANNAIGGEGGATGSISAPAFGTALDGAKGQGVTIYVGGTPPVNWAGGCGGSSYFGGAGSSSPSGATAAKANTGSGGGGFPGNQTANMVAGSGGGAGSYAEFIVPNPPASFSITVGSGGAGGAAGTSGGAGAAGANGYVEITEIYRSEGTIAASEVVSALYTDSSTSISGSLATIVYSTKEDDTHNAYSGGIFTCPMPGRYLVLASLQCTGTFVSGNVTAMNVDKNTTIQGSGITFCQGSTSQQQITVMKVIKCNAGDQLRIQVLCQATGPSIAAATGRNTLNIVRLGSN